jgi:transposase-like protein
MKTQKEQHTAVIRKKYTAQFKEQVLEREDRDGIPKVAKDLGLAESMPYTWRAQRSRRASRSKNRSSSKPRWPGSNGKRLA